MKCAAALIGSYSFSIRVIGFASRVHKVAGLDLLEDGYGCGGGLRDMNFGDGGM